MIRGQAPVYSSWRAGQTYTTALGGVITIQEGTGVGNPSHIVPGQQMQYYVTGPENWSRGGWQTRWDIIGGEVREGRPPRNGVEEKGSSTCCYSV